MPYEKQSRSISLRAARDEGTIYGVFVLTAERWRAGIHSIFGSFRADSSLRLLGDRPSIEDLFFFGNEKDFAPNFESKQKADAKVIELFPSHRVEYYSKGTEAYSQNGEVARIPVKKLDLDPRRNDLLREVFEYYVSDLEAIVSRLEEKDLPSDGRVNARIMANLKRFTPEIPLIALRCGKYFIYHESTKLCYNPPGNIVEVVGEVKRYPSSRVRVPNIKATRK